MRQRFSSVSLCSAITPPNQLQRIILKPPQQIKTFLLETWPVRNPAETPCHFRNCDNISCGLTTKELPYVPDLELPHPARLYRPLVAARLQRQTRQRGTGADPARSRALGPFGLEPAALALHLRAQGPAGIRHPAQPAGPVQRRLGQ